MVRPILQSLLLAKEVIQDQRTAAFTVCGIVNRCTLRRAVATDVDAMVGPGEPPILATSGQRDLSASGELPASLLSEDGPLWAYVNLTNVEGCQVFELRYVRLSDDRTFLQTEFSLESSDRLASGNGAIPIPSPIRMAPEPGSYALQLLWNSELLGMYRLQVGFAND